MNKNQLRATGYLMIAEYLKGLLEIEVIDTACSRHNMTLEETQTIKKLVKQEAERYREASGIPRKEHHV